MWDLLLDSTGHPLAAKWSDKIAPGDVFLAINAELLVSRPLDDVVRELQQAQRPARVLFQQKPQNGAKLPARL